MRLSCLRRLRLEYYSSSREIREVLVKGSCRIDPEYTLDRARISRIRPAFLLSLARAYAHATRSVPVRVYVELQEAAI